MNTKIKIIIDPKKHDRLELLKTIENTGIPYDINKDNIISVEKDKDIEISIRDMGIGFNPLVRDEELAYDFDNVMVLQSIASDIQYNLSLGMNDTTIRLTGKGSAVKKNNG